MVVVVPQGLAPHLSGGSFVSCFLAGWFIGALVNCISFYDIPHIVLLFFCFPTQPGFDLNILFYQIGLMHYSIAVHMVLYYSSLYIDTDVLDFAD